MSHPAAAHGAAILVALSQLDDRERYVIVQRHWQERTLSQIGDRLGLSRERVRQIETRAVRKLTVSLAPLREAA